MKAQFWLWKHEKVWYCAYSLRYWTTAMNIQNTPFIRCITILTDVLVRRRRISFKYQDDKSIERVSIVIIKPLTTKRKYRISQGAFMKLIDTNIIHSKNSLTESRRTIISESFGLHPIKQMPDMLLFNLINVILILKS